MPAGSCLHVCSAARRATTRLSPPFPPIAPPKISTGCSVYRREPPATAAHMGAYGRNAQRARRSRRQVHQRRNTGDGVVGRPCHEHAQQRRNAAGVVDVYPGLVSRWRSTDGRAGRARRPLAYAIEEHRLQRDAGVVQSARVDRVSPGRRRLAARLRVQRLSRTHAERDVPRIPGGEHADQSKRGARSRKADGLRRRCARDARPDVGQGDRLLERARRRDHEHHPVEHAAADYQDARERRQDADGRRGARSRCPAVAVVVGGLHERHR